MKVMINMNFYNLMVEELKKCVMIENQAKEVMQQYFRTDLLMNDHWKENIQNYPQNLQPMIWNSIKEFAYEWIKINCPETWFRPMFQYTENKKEQLMLFFYFC